MKAQITFHLTHTIDGIQGSENELLILTPEHVPIRTDVLFLHGHQIGARIGG